MRKFSKKIAMMMVLAMLVSMFSGIVSASAASVWSAKSVDDDNYAVVMGETIEVKKGEFINFDLFKADEEATEAGYEYTWKSSDADVLFINGAQGAKNGYARVKGEVGDEATITATFTNLTTGKSAERSFDVVVVEELEADVAEVEYEIAVNFGDEPFAVGMKYDLEAVVTADGEEIEADVVFSIDGVAIEGAYAPAEAGEVTIVATVTVDGEEIDSVEFTCEVIEDNAFVLEQVSMKTLKLTFSEGKDISKITKDAVLVYSSATADGTLFKEYVNKVEAKDNVLTVTLYNDMVKDQFITVKFADETASFKVFKGDVDAIEVISGPVMIGEAQKLNIKLYAGGIDVTNDALLNNVTVEIVAGGNDANIVNGNQIIFWTEGKEASVKATYHTYDYASSGNGTEKVFTSNVATITSRKTTQSISDVKTFTITNKTNSWEIAWNGKNYIALNDGGYKLVGKIDLITTTTWAQTQEKLTTELGNRLSYTSTNTSVLFVGTDGTLYPISTGNADIVVKDTANNNAIVGVYNITVKANREIANITASISKNLFSNNDSAQITVNAVDQYGDAISAGNLTFTNVATKATVNLGAPDWAGKYTVSGAGLGSANGTTYTYSIKTGNNKFAYVSFTVKNAEAPTGYKLNTGSFEVDTKVENKSDKSFAAAYAAKEIKIASTDKNGLLVGTGSTPITGKIANVNQTANVVDGAYYVVIDKPWYEGAIDQIAVVTDGVLKFNYLRTENGIIKKAAAGTYTVSLYKANQIKDSDLKGFTLVDVITITVKDTQAAYSATVKATKTNVTYDALNAAVTGSVVTTELITALDECYSLAKGNDKPTFASMGTTNLHNFAVAANVKPLLSFKEIKVYDTYTFAGGESLKLEMTINLMNQAIEGKVQ